MSSLCSHGCSPRCSDKFCVSPLRGFALIPVLFGVLIITSLVSTLLHRAYAAHRAAQQVDRYTQITGDIAVELQRGIVSATGCTVVRIPQHSFTVEWMACRESPTLFKTMPSIPLPDRIPNFDALFKRTKPCPTTRYVGPAKSFTAPTHAHTCSLGSQLTGSVSLRENIEFVDATIGKHGSIDHMSIATLGAVSATSPIRIEQDLLLVAGGNVSLPMLTTTAPDGVRVTVFATQGSIEVEGVHPKVSLLLIGRAGLKAPPTLFRPPFPLIPFRAAVLVGAAPRSRLP